MDQYGNMFIHTQDIGMNYHIRQVNHSTINSGREIICAGIIQLTAGQVTYITNTSGHYKPTKEHMVSAMSILAEEGLDLSGADVVTVRFPGPGPGLCYWEFYDPAEFIDSGGRCQPRKSEPGPEP
jgi:hypothetical protein